MNPVKDRLAALRQLIREKGGDGLIVPRTDAYQGEYVAPCDERLAWLTGFTGSAGMAVVLPEKAAIFIDGRYALQAQGQVDPDIYEILTDSSPCQWGKENLGNGEKLFYDPWLHTLNDIRRGEKVCELAGASFVPVAQNLIDLLWLDRPRPPSGRLKIHEMAYAGVSSEIKRQQIAESLNQKKINGVLLTACDSIAWLLNVRGEDIPHTPVAQGFAMLWEDGAVDLFMNPSRINSEVREHLGRQVRIHDPAVLENWLADLQDRKILVDPAQTPVALLQHLKNCSTVQGNDPCILPKAIKNPVEIAGAYQAHIQDGIAIVRFLAWLSRAITETTVTELEAAARLLSFRRQGSLLADISFETISATGAHGAIVHYRATPDTSRPLKSSELYLIDSGGQYLNGTTDITRTIAFGDPAAEQKDRFTRVLKGHMALAMACFPHGTTGSQLDSLARQFLWQAGLDYDHGTGHGVGSYLSVHEGPQRISKPASTVPLRPGMIVSNEPGYYKTGEYGIRIESLVLVVEKGIPAGGERPMLGFDTLTLAPIDISLTEVAMLTPEERLWLNSYHQKVYELLLPFLTPEEGVWLRQATEII